VTLDYVEQRSTPWLCSLPPFWPENTEAWFAIAEIPFRLRQTDEEQQMFAVVINALPKESLRTVLDLITDPLEDLPYTGSLLLII
jgi:hypothetical protein